MITFKIELPNQTMTNLEQNFKIQKDILDLMGKRIHWYTEDQLRSQHMTVHDLLVQRLPLISNQDLTTLQTPTTTSSSLIIHFPLSIVLFQLSSYFNTINFIVT